MRVDSVVTTVVAASSSGALGDAVIEKLSSCLSDCSPCLSHASPDVLAESLRMQDSDAHRFAMKTSHHVAAPSSPSAGQSASREPER